MQKTPQDENLTIFQRSGGSQDLNDVKCLYSDILKPN